MRVQPARLEYLTRLPRGLPRLKEFTDQLVENLIASGRLPSAVLRDPDPDTRWVRPQFHEVVARALAEHLASSGEFNYSLELTRRDKNLDPVEDFLLHTRTGHCQRFATALVLMLRTQGIPSQLVIGYRGCEYRGGGWYEVREDHAHAWVEVLVPAPDVDLMPVWLIAPALGPHWPAMRWQMLFGGNLPAMLFQLPRDWQPMRWISVDPTPAGDEASASSQGTFWSLARQKWETVLKTLVLTYNEEAREQAFQKLHSRIEQDGGAVAAAGGVILILAIGGMLWFGVGRSRASRSPLPPTMQTLLRVLAEQGWVPRPEQTMREFAQQVGATLRERGAPEDLIACPDAVVMAFYAARYGRRPSSATDLASINEQLQRLKSWLTASARYQRNTGNPSMPPR